MKRRHFVRAEDSSDKEEGEDSSTLESKSRKEARNDSVIENSWQAGNVGLRDKAHKQHNDGTQSISLSNPKLPSQGQIHSTKREGLRESSHLTESKQKENIAANDSAIDLFKATAINTADNITEENSSSSDSNDSEDSSSDSHVRPTFVRRRKPADTTTHSKVSREEAALSILAQEQNALQPIKKLELDDRDGIDPAAEHFSWTQRQLARQRRDQTLLDEAKKRLEHKQAIKD